MLSINDKSAKQDYLIRATFIVWILSKNLFVKLVATAREGETAYNSVKADRKCRYKKYFKSVIKTKYLYIQKISPL